MPALCKINGTQYLCAYTGDLYDGCATVLTVNTGTWATIKQTPFEYDFEYAINPTLAKIDDSHYLCAYTGTGNDGYAGILHLSEDIRP